MNSTPRLGLPFLSAGQAQKELFVNASLQALDILVAGAVEGPPLNAPPAAPELGSCYIADAAPTGAWAGKPHHVAAFTGAGWILIEPREGMTFEVKSSGVQAAFRAGLWVLGDISGSRVVIGGKQVVNERQGAIGSPSGGTTVDGEARTVIDQILTALRQHGLIDV